MAEDLMHDDSSHYEVSLTAGQAFIAFVLLLLSLAASFAFGIMVGRGQVGERLVVRTEPAVVSEAAIAAKGEASEIVELGMPMTETADETVAMTTDSAAPAETITITEGTATETAPPIVEPTATGTTAPVAVVAPKAEPPSQAVPHYAQLLSSSDGKAAEALAAKLINDGFTTAYVERIPSDKGIVYRVRVRFPSEADARASVERLKSYVKGEVWVTKQ